MAEFTRAIVARARQYVGDRRRSRRLSVRLPFSLSLISASKSLNGTRRVSSMDGHTLDVSTHSLGLIVPKITLDEHHLVGENRNFNVKLELPDGPLEMLAAPIRYERLEEHRGETGYLIAVKIVAMSDSDRTRFAEYIATLAKT
ncbi:MAG TPA: hypothetical protein VGW76_10590 [Pyrinomonadaceae bacterium]|nr:hypothetical protein [Pyrinomonadaceae bacterium]